MIGSSVERDQLRAVQDREYDESLQADQETVIAPQMMASCFVSLNVEMSCRRQQYNKNRVEFRIYLRQL